MLEQIVRYRVIEDSLVTDNEWIKFIQNSPESSIYQHPLWLKVLEEETNQRLIKLVCRDNDGKLAGVMPLQFTKGIPFGLGGVLGTKRISSLPRTPVSGIISLNDAVTELLIAKAIDIKNNFHDFRIQIKSSNKDLNNRIEKLSRHFWRPVYITDIPKYPAQLRFHNSENHSSIKRAVNKAIKNGVKVRYSDSEEDLLKWYKLYLDTMKFHTNPPRSLRFFRSLWKNLKRQGLMHLMIAEKMVKGEDIIIAGSIFFSFNKTVVYAFNGSNRNDFDLRPNDLIHWTIIHDSQLNGFEIYDLGEVTLGQTGLAAYKQKWASRTIDMYHYYYPAFKIDNSKEFIDSANRRGFIKKLWEVAPDRLTSFIGSQFYNRL